jgi:RNase adaptor protein for sRNA GlmZ degradation
VSVARILVVTGASGAGKTATVRALDARALPGVHCFYFDSIGVPTAEVMERDYVDGERWQASATGEWLARLSALHEDVRVAVLDGQTRPSFVFSAAARAAPRTAHVVLLDCSSDVRAARLRGPRRQPELADVRMDHWAAYLRGQADALDLAVIDTSQLTVTEAAAQLEEIVRRLSESDD